jgi:hypothetical protein
MVGIAARRHMQICIVAQNSRRLYRIILIVFCKFLDAVVGLLIHQIPLLDPAFESTGGAHARETLFAVHHFDALSIFHVADAVINGRHLVA